MTNSGSQNSHRIRYGMVGGGEDAFIGNIHRIAASIDNHYHLVAGVFSSDPERSVHFGNILNLSNGNRLETYVIKGKGGSGEVCINGAAAHLVSKGDLVIIVAFWLKY